MTIPTLIVQAAPQAPSTASVAGLQDSSDSPQSAPFSQLLDAPASASSGSRKAPAAPKTASPSAGPSSPDTQDVSKGKAAPKADAGNPEDALASAYAGWLASTQPVAAPLVLTVQAKPAMAPAAAKSDSANAATLGSNGSKGSIASAPLPAPPTPVAPQAKVPQVKAPAGEPVAASKVSAAPQKTPSVTAEKSPIAAASVRPTLPSKPEATQDSPVAPVSAATARVATPVAATPSSATESVQKLAAAGQSPAGQGAKIAAGNASGPSGRNTPNRVADKKILSVAGNDVTNVTQGVGTTVAKVSPVMQSTFQSDRSPTAFTVSGIVSAGSHAGSAQPEDATSFAQPVSNAHGAVDAALKAAETLQNSASNSVNLQFTVGSHDLSLRLEMKSGEVHATFRTDSAELRGSLAQEWQAVNADSGTVKLAAPVFTSSQSDSNANPDFGDQSNNPRASQQDRSFSSHLPTGLSLGAGSSSEATPAPETTGRAPAALATSLHLQAFA